MKKKKVIIIVTHVPRLLYGFYQPEGDMKAAAPRAAEFISPEVR